MKPLLLLQISVFILISNFSFSQSKLDSLRFADTKFSIGLTAPFGISTFMYNVRDKWGGFISVLYSGSPGVDDDNDISPWHELTNDYIINHRGGSVGLMYRIWRPLHVYGGVGIGWGTRQLIYEDTPPVVLENAYRTTFDGIKLMAHGGLQLTFWRLSFGAGYNTFVKGTEFFVGYVVKFKPNENN